MLRDCRGAFIRRDEMINEMNICDYIKTRPAPDEEVLVDIRDKVMFGFGSIPGAVNIPLDEISHLYDLPQDRTIYVFCQAGEVSGEIAEILSDAGYTACNLTGGYREYLRQHLPECL